jgi:glc operon protein GlcG
MNKKWTIILFAFICYSTVKAQEGTVELNFTQAHKIMQHCVAYADSSKLKVAVAVYDTKGQLLCFAKMDGASVAAAKVAQWKGLSASLYQFSTAETATWKVPNAPDIATVPGGIVVKNNQGKFLGSVGVSGAAANVDVLCAEAGVRKTGLQYK